MPREAVGRSTLADQRLVADDQVAGRLSGRRTRGGGVGGGEGGREGVGCGEPRARCSSTPVPALARGGGGGGGGGGGEDWGRERRETMEGKARREPAQVGAQLPRERQPFQRSSQTCSAHIMWASVPAHAAVAARSRLKSSTPTRWPPSAAGDGWPRRCSRSSRRGRASRACRPPGAGGVFYRQEAHASVRITMARGHPPRIGAPSPRACTQALVETAGVPADDPPINETAPALPLV